MSSSVGFGFSASNAVALMIIPLVQYPHWGTCSLMKAACTAFGADVDPRPSGVTTDLLCTLAIVSRQDRVGRPSISTLQAPHCPRPQPNFVGVRPRPRSA